MTNNIQNDQQPHAAAPQPTAPIEKMLDALDELMAAARRVAVATSTTPDQTANPASTDELSIDSR